MANFITFIRLILLLVLVLSIYWADPSWQRVNMPLLFLIMVLDALDGWVARKFNETSLFGAVFDIAVDRIVETVLWVVLAHIGLVPVWAAIVFIVRGNIVDTIRNSMAASQGVVPFRHDALTVGPAAGQQPFQPGLLQYGEDRNLRLGLDDPAHAHRLPRSLGRYQRHFRHYHHDFGLDVRDPVPGARRAGGR
jgi:hypothetical protein